MAITKHSEGSIRELWSISFPLMLSSFSVMSMLFVDRILLANYSVEALNAAVNSTTLGWAFIMAWMVLTSISEVFVAQFNGADQKNILGKPVWQMIWLSITSFLFFIPLANWGPAFFFGISPEKQMQREYFHYMMLFGPSFPIYSALCGFFVGQGKMKLITILAVAANFMNALLDVILIFGIPGWVPSLGVTGAAIATSGGAIFQVAVLMSVFLSEDNRKAYGTAEYLFDRKLFWQCLKIGMPGAVFVSIEILGWATYYSMMANMGEAYITVIGICQSIAILFYFFPEGVNKAVTTVVGNLIGAKRLWFIPQVLYAGFKIHLFFFIIIGTILYFGSDILVKEFLPKATPELIESIDESIAPCLIFIVIYLLLEGWRLVISGALTAAGDTVFLLIAGSLSVWMLLVLPVYLFVVKGAAEVQWASFFCVTYSLAACAIYLWRFLDGKWEKKSILT